MILIIVITMSLISGSFIGVLVYRIPAGNKIIFSRSKCDYCKSVIPFYNNIPIISFIFQKGKCKYCKENIDFFYFILELIIPVVFIVMYYLYQLNITFFYKTTVFSILITVMFIDIKTHIIPDRFCIILFIVSFVYYLSTNKIENWYLGLASYSLPALLMYGFSDIFKKEIIGFGDVKLLCSVGGFLSYTNLKNLVYFYEILYVSAGLFSIFLIYYKKRNSKSYIAFAPFICFAAFIAGA